MKKEFPSQMLLERNFASPEYRGLTRQALFLTLIWIPYIQFHNRSTHIIMAIFRINASKKYRG
jgi:hypothetical protein